MTGRATATVQADPAPAPASAGSSRGPVRRKCACGGTTTSAGGECEQCRRRRLGIQARLTVGPSGDVFEREADRAADRAVDGADRRAHGDALPRFQAQTFASGSDRSPAATPEVERALARPGRALAPEVRRWMEDRFERGFGGVRIHTDAEAARSARTIGARAYSHGSHVVFGAGEYRPDAREGRRLIAHELAHVVQQGAVPSAPIRRRPDGSDPLDAGVPAVDEFTEQDAAMCSPRYLQKLCVYVVGGFDGDRSGVETPDQMSEYNSQCRRESAYDGPDVTLSDSEKHALRSPRCSRGGSSSAKDAARDQRIARALRLSLKYMPTGVGEGLERILQDPVFLGSLAIAIGVYLALWLAPEPVFSKLAAAATTIAILSTGVFSVSTILNLARAFGDLEDEAGGATSDEDVRRAAEKFGRRIGAVEADLIVFLGTLLLGRALPTPRGLPPGNQALAEAERAMTSASEGGVVVEGPWGKGRAVSPSGGSAPAPVPGRGSNLALKIEVGPEPVGPVPKPATAPEAKVIPLPTAKPATAPAPAKAPAASPLIVPAMSPAPDQSKKKRPPFVLRLPLQKEPHLGLYRGWLGMLQSDPAYDRGSPAQLDRWHRELRPGGSEAVWDSVYARGHSLGLTNEEIRVPTWSRTKSLSMQVDHVVELQVTPADKRELFDTVPNYELLDSVANQSSGGVLRANIAAERALQEAADPSLVGKVLKFEAVELRGGVPGERWGLDEIRSGEHLDVYEQAGRQH